MAKDFFQDILPKDDARPRRDSGEPTPSRRDPGMIRGDEVDVPSDSVQDVGLPQVPERSIRNINVNRPRPMDRMPERGAMPSQDRREVPPVGGGLPKIRRAGTPWWIWIAGLLLIVLIAVIALFMYRTTSVHITPRAHTIVFDSTKSFTAYPASQAQNGTISYTVQTFDVDDSQSVAASGSAHAERKASGSVTLVNEFSTAPVNLVATTRFQTPDGLIFRAPADLVIPGMKGNTPGTITVTLVADQAGDKYNVAPVSRFTLPGLKGGAMYDKVYARSTAAFTGGFSGEEANVAPQSKSAAVAEMQGRLKDKLAQQFATAAPEGMVLFPSLAKISYTDQSPTASATSGEVNLNERAHVEVPMFSMTELSKMLASTVSADAENATITLVPKDGFGASLTGTSTALGSAPISFALSGTAQLVWNIDPTGISEALAGKDQSAFQTVVNGFPGVQEARARIEPFWNHSFPSDPKKIQIEVGEPVEGTNP